MAASPRLQIRVSDDELEARVRVGPGAPSNREDLDAALAAFEIRHGLDRRALDTIERALAREAPLPDEICIARGEAATEGRPATLLLEEPGGPLPGTLREDGSLDFRERRLVVPVREGDAVATIRAATPGKPGRNVLGAPIEPPPPPEVEFVLGDGVAIEDDRVVATRDGARSVGAKGELDVVDVYVHEGAVDLESGNLDSQGSLQITRDVELGMRVRAERDIEIGGVVDGGIVEAGGSVEIGRGVIGRGVGSVRAGGDLRVGHGLGARMRAIGAIRVSRSLSTSRLHAQEIEVEGKVLSDELAAERVIRVREAGSPAGGPCRLRAAVPLDPADFDPSHRPAPTARADSRSRKDRGRGGRRSRPGRDRTDRKADLKKRLAWRTHQRLLEGDARIVIEGVGHPGCSIEIGGVRWVLERSIQGHAFKLDREHDRITWTEIPR